MSVLSEPDRSSRPVENHYDITQRTLHWAMAAIILLAVAIGFTCSYLQPGTPVRQFLLEIHKSLGMTALFLLVVRFPYRLLKGAPVYREHLGPLVHFAASVVHWGLYAIMLYMPVSGYVTSAAGGRSLPWFGLFQWPKLLPTDRPLAHEADGFHVYGAYVIYVLLGLHIAAVIWHTFVKHDGILSRMWPARS